jgi:hypothetical protein
MYNYREIDFLKNASLATLMSISGTRNPYTMSSSAITQQVERLRFKSHLLLLTVCGVCSKLLNISKE